MKKVLSIILIIGLTLGSTGIFVNAISMFSTLVSYVTTAQELLYNIVGHENNDNYVTPAYNSPLKKIYSIPGNDGSSIFEGDGYELLTRILKYQIKYRETTNLVWHDVIPDFSSEQIRDAIYLVSKNYYLFQDSANVYSYYYYSIYFKSEIENAYLKAFENQIIFIRTGTTGDSLDQSLILTRKGFLQEISNSIFATGPFKFKVVNNARVMGSENPIQFSMYSLVQSDVEFDSMYPVVYPS